MAVSAVVAVLTVPFAAMGLATVIALRRGNGGVADAVWSMTTGVTGALLALSPWPFAGPMPDGRPLLVAGLALVWGLRLGLYIAARVAREREDARYAALRKAWGEAYPVRLFGFLQLQALMILPLAGAIGLAGQRPGPFGWLDLLGTVLLLAAVAGETIADRQLARFKADPGNKGRICDRGLWAWSRHPNYFFEWLAWIAWPVIALDTAGGYPLGFLALVAPLLMYYLLVHVSGIPPLEAHMAATRGAAFEAYRARTSAFFPWPPGKAGDGPANTRERLS